MPFVVATIVEGHGETAALPELLRRIEPRFYYPRPIRVPRANILTNALNRYLQFAKANITEQGGLGVILIVLDADDDCAAILGPERAQAATLSADVSSYCVLAVREFESWLLAGLADLQHMAPDPESPRDCKGLLARALGRYRPVVDQSRLVARIDIEEARRRSPSFDKLCRVMAGLRLHT